MKITSIKFYDGALAKTARLGMSDMFLELLAILLDTEIRLKEEKDANSGKFVRMEIDKNFEIAGGWTKTVTGNLDWVKTRTITDDAEVKLGVEIQVSARSDLVIRDLLHMRQNIKSGSIDVVVLAVPSNLMSKFLPDRAPSLADTVRYVEDEFDEIQQFPLIVIAVEHDGAGDPLPKQKRRA